MPDTTKPHRAVWIGRTASALVVAALLVDGAMQLFAPAKIASMMQETGFAMDLAPTLGGIMVACAVLYSHPGYYRPRRHSRGRFFGRRHLCPYPPRRTGIIAGNHIPSSRPDDVGWRLPARSPYPRHSASQPLTDRVLFSSEVTMRSFLRSLSRR